MQGCMDRKHRSIRHTHQAQHPSPPCRSAIALFVLLAPVIIGTAVAVAPLLCKAALDGASIHSHTAAASGHLSFDLSPAATVPATITSGTHTRALCACLPSADSASTSPSISPTPPPLPGMRLQHTVAGDSPPSHLTSRERHRSAHESTAPHPCTHIPDSRCHLGRLAGSRSGVRSISHSSTRTASLRNCSSILVVHTAVTTAGGLRDASGTCAVSSGAAPSGPLTVLTHAAAAASVCALLSEESSRVQLW